MKTPPFSVAPSGESCLTLTVQTDPGPLSTRAFRKLCEKTKVRFGERVIDFIPSYVTLLVRFDELSQAPLPLTRFLETAFEEAWNEACENPAEDAGNLIELPVCYDPSLAPDLERVAKEKKLPVSEVVRLHSEKTYLTYAVGFTPGFPFLGMLDPALNVPRLKNPRKSIPGGSVGIAGNQTGIYPLDSPGGWNLIGRCPTPVFFPREEKVSLFQIGDRVKFHPISVEKYELLSSRQK